MIDVWKLFSPYGVHLARIFERGGYEIRAVGGCVRDTLMGERPKDIDLATNATPQQMLNLLDLVGIKTIPTGLQHGTITAVIHDTPYEITTLRIDKETDGRHAVVEFTTDWEADAARRDFTINAMSVDADGNLYDYFGGKTDLENRVIRFVGSAEDRIREDYLRILRYFRFRTRINDRSEDLETYAALFRNSDGLERISGERIWSEMGKILSMPAFIDQHGYMTDTRVFDVIGMHFDHHDDLLEFLRLTYAAMDVVGVTNPIIPLAVMLEETPRAERIAARWKLSNADRDLLLYLVSQNDPINRNIRPNGLDRRDLKRIAVDSKKGTAYAVALACMFGWKDEALDISEWPIPEMPLRGSDLIADGHEQGPQLGMLLALARTRWINSDYEATKDDLIAFVDGERKRMEFVRGQ